MVNEVSKLLFNALIKRHVVYLPDVGMLRVVRHAAAMSSRNELIPPHFKVEYTLDNLGKSLIDIISEEADVDSQRAEEIYTRWLDKVREERVVTIDRVGVLRDKSFDTDDTLLKSLNIANEPLRITRKHSKASLYVAIALVFICAICGGGWWYLNSKPTVAPAEVVVESAVVISEPELALVTEVEPIEEEDVEVIDIIEEVVVDWRTRDDLRHWVVVGSYSTTENAERAISDILKRFPESQCDYFKLGSMYAVAIFGSADIEECQEFKEANSNNFPQSWVYTPKRFR